MSRWSTSGVTDPLVAEVFNFTEALLGANCFLAERIPVDFLPAHFFFAHFFFFILNLLLLSRRSWAGDRFTGLDLDLAFAFGFVAGVSRRDFLF